MGDLAQAAERRLSLWDIPTEQIAAIESTGHTQATITFPSPASGVVLDKPAVLGLHVMPGQTLYRIGDLSSVWMDADVREADLPLVRIGAPVTVTLDGMGGAPMQGRAIYLSPTLQDETRTAKLRVELPNANGRLKPGMFATMDFDGAPYSALIVPTDAVLDSGSEQMVFVAEDEGHFTPRRVQVRARLDDVVAIASGVREGERVATGAAFFLDSESQVRGAAAAYDPPASGVTPAPSSTSSRAHLDIALHTTPDPLRTGDNDLEVVVRDAQGAPVADADVTVLFYMAPMPSMNMPAMRQSVRLAPSGGGRYRGNVDVMMSGRWDVTVSVTRAGRVVGTAMLSLSAK
jgi:Cu(I)/Ag(I) efflux system membrane fusion protein